MKSLSLVSLAGLLVLCLSGCTYTGAVKDEYPRPLFGIGGKFCAMGVCVSPEANLNASVPTETVIVNPTPTPPVVAYAPAPLPPPVSYNPAPLPVRTLEK